MKEKFPGLVATVSLPFILAGCFNSHVSPSQAHCEKAEGAHAYRIVFSDASRKTLIFSAKEPVPEKRLKESFQQIPGRFVEEMTHGSYGFAWEGHIVPGRSECHIDGGFTSTIYQIQ